MLQASGSLARTWRAPLPIDFQQQLPRHSTAPPARFAARYRSNCRRPWAWLEKLMVRDHFLKALGADEVVIAPGDFVGPGACAWCRTPRTGCAARGSIKAFTKLVLPAPEGAANYVKASLVASIATGVGHGFVQPGI